MARRRTAKNTERPATHAFTLVDGANQLTFGADPVVELKAGETFTTDDPGVAAFLDEHPAAVRVKGSEG